jgi:hypothetical protein
MQSIVNLGTVFMVLGLCAACGDSENSAPADAMPAEGASVEADPVATEVDQLHAFDVDGVHYEILAVDGDLLMNFSRPRFTPLPEVVAEDGGDLTLLELYLALQPEGVPDQRLVDAHVAQAADLGRQDAAVHAAVLVQPSLQKSLQDDCITAAAGFTGGTFQSPFYTKSSLITAQNGTCTSARTSAGELGYMLLEVCNTAPSAQAQSVQFAKKQGIGSFITQFTTAIAANNSSGIIQNSGNHTIRFDLRAKVTTAIPSFGARVICGTFGESR